MADLLGNPSKPSALKLCFCKPHSLPTSIAFVGHKFDRSVASIGCIAQKLTRIAFTECQFDRKQRIRLRNARRTRNKRNDRNIQMVRTARTARMAVEMTNIKVILHKFSEILNGAWTEKRTVFCQASTS